MDNGKCMIEVNSKKELETIQNNSEFSVTMYRSDNCSHCRETHPIVEARCNDMEGMIPVIDCPVDKKFCLNQLKDMGETSIPMLMGVKTGDRKNPAFVVKGAQISNINHNFDILKGWIEEAKRNSGKRPDARPSVQQVMTPDVTNDEGIRAMLGFGAVSGQPSRRPVSLCTPGYDCNTETFEDQAIAYMLSMNGNRNRSRG